MTTFDKTVLGLLIVIACGVGVYEYWAMLEPLRVIAHTLVSSK